MKTLILHGDLAEKFGERWTLDIRTPGEGLRAIDVNCPGFLQHILDSGKNGVGYRVLADDRALEPDDLVGPVGHEVLHVIPVIGGAGKGGGIILGIIMIAAAVVTMGGSLAAMAAMTWGEAFAAGGAALMSKIAFSIGTSLILSGLSQMLTSTPQTPMDLGSSSSGVSKPSYFFNGPAQTIDQGSAVPVGYGELLIGSQPISSGLSAENIV